MKKTNNDSQKKSELKKKYIFSVSGIKATEKQLFRDYLDCYLLAAPEATSFQHERTLNEYERTKFSADLITNAFLAAGMYCYDLPNEGEARKIPEEKALKTKIIRLFNVILKSLCGLLVAHGYKEEKKLSSGKKQAIYEAIRNLEDKNMIDNNTYHVGLMMVGLNLFIQKVPMKKLAIKSIDGFNVLRTSEFINGYLDDRLATELSSLSTDIFLAENNEFLAHKPTVLGLFVQPHSVFDAVLESPIIQRRKSILKEGNGMASIRQASYYEELKNDGLEMDLRPQSEFAD